MKRILAYALTVVMLITCLSSCGVNHRKNTWFSDVKLEECLVSGLPKIEKDYINQGDEDLYVKFTEAEYQAYVKEIYEYLKAQDFEYFGTRGEQKGTLAGTLTTYYFKPADELSEFEINGHYKFVFSDGTVEDGDVVFCILTIYDYETKKLEYRNQSFTYNSVVSLRRKSEAPFSGIYILEEKTEQTEQSQTKET